MSNDESSDRPAVRLGTSLSVAVVIMAASNVLSRLLGFLRISIIANCGGLSSDVDAYAFSFILPDLLNHLLAGSALSITFIPIFQRYLSRKDTQRAYAVFSNVLTVGTVFFGLFILAGMFFTKDILLLAGKNISGNPHTLALTLKLTRIILPAQMFFFWGALLNGVQYSHRRFLGPALAPLMYNLGIILGGVCLYPFVGIEGFSWGVLAGAFVGNIVVQLPSALRLGLRYRPVFDVRDRDFRAYVLTTLPLILGLGMTFSNEFFPKLFGSFVSDGVGAVASLDYSYKLMYLLAAVFGQAFATGFYPFLSQYAVEGKFSQMSDLLARMVQRVGAIIIPLSGVILALAPNIIAVVLQHGQFREQATHRTAAIFSFYVLGAFFCAGFLIVSRAYYALHNTIFPMIVSTAAVLLTVPAYIGMGHVMGAKGIALASSVSMAVQFAIVTVAWFRRFPDENQKAVLGRLGLIVAVSAGGALVSAAAKSLLVGPAAVSTHGFSGNLLICAVSGGLGLAIIFGILELSGVGVMRQGLRRLFGRFRTGLADRPAP